MSRESTIRDLRVKARQLEQMKRAIDKQVEAIYTTLRVFELNGDETLESVSEYAQEITDAMYDVLLIERPLHREIILTRVQERGISIGGEKPVNTIGSYLSRDDRFRGAGNKGFWTLAEEPHPEPSDETYNNGHRLLSQGEPSTSASER